MGFGEMTQRNPQVATDQSISEQSAHERGYTRPYISQPIESQAKRGYREEGSCLGTEKMDRARQDFNREDLERLL